MNDKTSTHSASINARNTEAKVRSKSGSSFRKPREVREKRNIESFSRDREFRERGGDMTKSDYNDRDKILDNRVRDERDREPRYYTRDGDIRGGYRDNRGGEFRGDRVERGGRDRFRENRRDYRERDFRENRDNRDNRDNRENRDYRERRDSRDKDYDRRDKSFRMYEGRRKSRSGSPKYIKKSSRQNSAENAGNFKFYKYYF
jgi:hypothetical protein